jgi:hypothetical protein
LRLNHSLSWKSNFQLIGFATADWRDRPSRRRRSAFPIFVEPRPSYSANLHNIADFFTPERNFLHVNDFSAPFLHSEKPPALAPCRRRIRSAVTEKAVSPSSAFVQMRLPKA